MMVLCDRVVRGYDVWISFGSVHEVRAFRVRKKRSLWFRVLVLKMGGGEVNTVTGDLVFEIMEGYMIENGKITYPIRSATLIGNGPKALMDEDADGSDLGRSIGTCGKDGQGVPVSDAQPTLRIRSMGLGGTEVRKDLLYRPLFS